MTDIKKEIEKIQIPSEVTDYVFKGIQQAKMEELAMKRGGSKIKKRLIGSFVGLVAAGGLFVGSTFVSPAMAEVAGKIPYLKEAFLKDVDKQGVKSVFAQIREEGLKRGYTVHSMGVGGWLKEDDHTVFIYLQNKDYNVKTKADVEALAKKMLEKKGYYAESIKVLPLKADFYSSVRRYNRIAMEEANDIKTRIKEKGYHVDYVGMNPGMDEIFVLLPVSEKRVEEVRSIVQTYQKEQYNEFTVEIRNSTDQETKLKQKLYNIFEGLVEKKDAYKVNYFTYNTKGNLLITIKTSNEREEQNVQNQIQKEVLSQLEKYHPTVKMIGLEDLPAIGED